MGRKWTQEEKDAMSAKAKARMALGIKAVEGAVADPNMTQRMGESGGGKGPSPSAPPPNLFSGTTKKLEVFGKPGSDPNDPVPGFQLYWFDDIEGGLVIAQAKASGWVFVEKSEVALNDANTSPGNNDLGGNVRRWVSQGPNAEPVYAYLMKKPNWLHELHMTGPDSLEQRVHKQQEAQLRAGTIDVGADERRYAGVRGVNISVGGFKPS